MLIDPRTVPASERIDANNSIIASGPAGLAIAEALGRRNFTTGGGNMPTLNLVALALRLADRIAASPFSNAVTDKLAQRRGPYH